MDEVVETGRGSRNVTFFSIFSSRGGLSEELNEGVDRRRREGVLIE